MPIDFPCPACGKTARAPDDLAGQAVRCTACRAVIHVPAPGVLEAEEVVVASPVAAPPSPAPPATQPQSAADVARQPCPLCGEAIALTARKCRFCGAVLDPTLRQQAGEEEKIEDGAEMGGADYVVAMLCPVIGCFVSLAWLINGRPAATRMAGLTLLSGVLWTALSAFMSANSR